MKSYIVSIVICSILIALTELILPQKKLKSVVSTVFSLTLLVVMIKPLSTKNNEEFTFTFTTNEQPTIIDTSYLNAYFDDRLELYYQTVYKNQLLNNDLVAEKIIIELSDMKIVNVQIFLSNLVIPEENSHINNNVIKNYVANILGLDPKKVQIYVWINKEIKT